MYEGKAHGTLASVDADFRVLSRSLIGRVMQVLRCDVWCLWGRLALADGNVGSLKRAARCARKLERERIGYAAVWALLLRAGIAAQKGNAKAASGHLTNTIERAEQHDLLLCAAAARRRLGELLGGDEGAALIAAADDWMNSEGIVNPERMTEVFAPGFGRGRC